MISFRICCGPFLFPSTCLCYFLSVLACRHVYVMLLNLQHFKKKQCKFFTALQSISTKCSLQQIMYKIRTFCRNYCRMQCTLKVFARTVNKSSFPHSWLVDTSHRYMISTVNLNKTHRLKVKALIKTNPIGSVWRFTRAERDGCHYR